MPYAESENLQCRVIYAHGVLDSGEKLSLTTPLTEREAFVRAGCLLSIEAMLLSHAELISNNSRALIMRAAATDLCRSHPNPRNLYISLYISETAVFTDSRAPPKLCGPQQSALFRSLLLLCARVL